MPDNQLNDTEREAAAQILGVLAQFSPEQAERILAHVQHQADARSLPMFARGIAGPLGKLEHELKTKVDELTHGLFLQHCAMRGSDAAGVLRDCTYALVHGKTYQQMVVEKISHDSQRTEAMVRLLGSFQAPEFGGARHG